MSDNPKIVLYEGRGGRMRCGEFVREEDGRIKVRNATGVALAHTSIREEKKLSPLEACGRHNHLLDELEDARAKGSQPEYSERAQEHLNQLTECSSCGVLHLEEELFDGERLSGACEPCLEGEG